jgi:transposase InsO family protein
VQVTRRTLSEWNGAVADLLEPIVRVMHREQVRQSPWTQCDDTTLDVQDPSRAPEIRTGICGCIGVSWARSSTTLRGLNDGSCLRLRPQYPNHVWADDLVADRTVEGRPLKMLTVIDEFSRQCLAITVARRLNSDDVLATLTELMVKHGPPAFLRSDNGGEFTAGVVSRLAQVRPRSKRCISSPAVAGKMATMNRLTASCGMN